MIWIIAIKSLKRLIRSELLTCTRLSSVAVQALGLIFLLLFSAAATAVTDDELRAAFIFGFVKHVQWPNEAESETLTIGFFPAQPRLKKLLVKGTRGRSIRGKTLIYKTFSSAESALDINVLVIDSSVNSSLQAISTALSQRKILIVTDQAPDNLHTMINFIRHDQQSLSFEVHRPNIIFEGLKLDNDILLMGGSELDIARIYKETETALSKIKKSLALQEIKQKSQLAELRDQRRLLMNKTHSIELKAAELKSLDESLREIRTHLNADQNRMDKLKIQLVEEESVLKRKSFIVYEKTQDIEKNERLIELQRSAIIGQLSQIDEQQGLINAQDDSLEEKTAKIEEQKDLLFYQKLMTLSFILVAIISLYVVYRRIKVNRMLSESSRQLKLANEAKSVFLSTMSHEIRTPMNGVLGMADLLAGTKLTSEQRRYLDVVKQSGDLLLNVINDILDYSKIEAGKMELDNIDYNLNDLLYGCASTFVQTAHKKGIEFNLLVDPQLPENLHGDPDRICQVINNFLSNAFKFTIIGRVKIFACYMADNGMLKIGVQDTGSGMTPEQCEKIFKPFIQAETNTSRRFGGTGLGLSISLKLANLMQGEIKVTSRVDEGSSFWLQIPMSPVASAERLMSNNIKNLRVLVLEKHVDVSDNICAHLTRWGIKTKTYESLEVLIEELSGDLPETAVNSKSTVVLLSDKVASRDSILCRKLVQKLSTIYLSSDPRDSEIALPQGRFSSLLHQPVTASMIFNALIDTVEADDRIDTTIVGVIKAEVTTADVTTADVTTGDVTTIKSIRKTVLNESVRIVPQYPQARVLVAEDNSVNRSVIRGLLQQYGIVPTMVENGLLALGMLNGKPFDLVLMDCEMPVLSGYDACSRYRKTEVAESPLPIVALTAHAMEEHREQAKAVGMTEHLAKPIVRKDFERVLERYCGEK